MNTVIPKRSLSHPLGVLRTVETTWDVRPVRAFTVSSFVGVPVSDHTKLPGTPTPRSSISPKHSLCHDGRKVMG